MPTNPDGNIPTPVFKTGMTAPWLQDTIPEPQDSLERLMVGWLEYRKTSFPGHYRDFEDFMDWFAEKYEVT